MEIQSCPSCQGSGAGGLGSAREQRMGGSREMWIRPCPGLGLRAGLALGTQWALDNHFLCQWSPSPCSSGRQVPLWATLDWVQGQKAVILPLRGSYLPPQKGTDCFSLRDLSLRRLHRTSWVG